MTRLALLAAALLIAGSAEAQITAPAQVNGCVYNSGAITLQPLQTAPFQCDSHGQILISGTINATSALNATSTLPTLSSGSQSPQGSLAGAGYVQPVFGSASGGGTQVDGSHGLPVNIIAGGTAPASVGTTGAAVPGSADYAGMNVSGNLTGLVGTANGLKVDGSAVTQPVSGTVTANAGSGTFTVSGTVTANQGGAPWAENITQVAGASIATGHGTAAGSIRVELPTDGTGIVGAAQSGTWNVTNISGTVSLPTGAATSSLQTTGNTALTTINTTLGSPFQAGGSIGNTSFAATQSGTWTVQPGNTANTSPWLVKGNDGTNSWTVKAASTSPALTDTSVVVAQSPNPAPVCTGTIAISQTSSTDLKTFSNVGFICSIVLVSATAQSISLVEGTGSVCATGIAALIGGTSASMALAANGGFSAIAPRPWLKLGTSADHLCLLQSGGGNVSGVITYADHA